MIVIGLGFGDEGKGLTTSYLVSQTKNPLVIRFNGGHQAGHTVIKDGTRHVFSSFGSGVLHGAPTFISHYCTFYPVAFLNEWEVLQTKISSTPYTYVHPLCEVTTPYDVAFNQKIEDDRGDKRHGSVGVGFGTTKQRNQDYFKLFVKDLQYPKIVRAKLANISKYYGFELEKEAIDQFIEDCSNSLNLIDIVDYQDIKRIDNWNYIFEGAQGILLDQDHGFFPNVTRSNTTTQNALEIWDLVKRENHPDPEVYYITRCYQTRHGAGFMSDERDLELVNNENETNISHEYQGDFRIGKLDSEMVQYALDTDLLFHKHRNLKKHLVITCLDQYKFDVDSFVKWRLNTEFDSVLTSDGPDPKNIKPHVERDKINFV